MSDASEVCRVCGGKRVWYSGSRLCRVHYNQMRNEARWKVKPPGKRGRKRIEGCRVCGGPRREDIKLALCAKHYSEYVRSRYSAVLASKTDLVEDSVQLLHHVYETSGVSAASSVAAVEMIVDHVLASVRVRRSDQ